MMHWILISILVFFKGTVFSAPSIEELIKEGDASYIEGNNALTIEQRKAAFNRALSYYYLVNQQTGEQSADLDKAIANSFYQLNEYPWAVLYYTRALNKGSLDPLVKTYLQKAREHLGLPPLQYQNASFIQYLLLEPWISLNQKLKIFFWIMIGFFALSSLFIWFRDPLWKMSAIGVAIFCSIFLINILATYYLIPVEGIIIESTGLFRGPAKNEPQISTDPLLAGTKIKILESSETGDWLKIENENRLIGYVPITHLRML